MFSFPRCTFQLRLFRALNSEQPPTSQVVNLGDLRVVPAPPAATLRPSGFLNGTTSLGILTFSVNTNAIMFVFYLGLVATARSEVVATLGLHSHHWDGIYWPGMSTCSRFTDRLVWSYKIYLSSFFVFFFLNKSHKKLDSAEDRNTVFYLLSLKMKVC